MSRQTLEFNQDLDTSINGAFVGFVGKTSLTSSKSIVRLGAVGFTCWEDELEHVKTIEDNVKDFYEEYEPVVWILFAILILIFIACIGCGVWVSRSLTEVRKLRQEKDVLAVYK